MREASPWLRVVRAGLLFTALLCAHCASLDNTEALDSDFTHNNCEADADCPDGVCDPELRLCVIDQLPDSVSSKNYFLHIVPPENSSLFPQVAEFSIRSTDQPVIAYTLETPVVGRIRTVRAVSTGTELEIGEQLNARVAFIPSIQIDPAIDRPAYVFQTDDDPAGTEISLPPGRYDLTVKNIEQQLADEYYPDLHLTNVLFTEDGTLLQDSGQELDVIASPNVILVPRAPVVVRGVVRRGTLPVNDLLVRALDPVEQRVVSTVDTTSCTSAGINCGQFEIGLTEGIGNFLLLISHRREPGYPTVRIAGLEVPPGQTEIDLSTDARLNLPELSAPLNCQVRVLRANPFPAANEQPLTTQAATVVFSSSEVGGGEVFLTVDTNESGNVERSTGQPGVYLYPGNYHMTVYPPFVGIDAAADYSVYNSPEPVLISAEVVTPEGYIQLPDALLELRARLSGVLRAESAPVAAATVLATPLGQDPLMRTSASLTDTDGSFNLWYDSSPDGSYDLTLAPPADSGYSWLLWHLKNISDDTIDDLVVDLPIPLKAKIQLRAQGFTVEGTVVEFYEDIYLLDEPAPLVGRGTADADGEVTVLLPPEEFPIEPL